jgi:NTE family protein
MMAEMPDFVPPFLLDRQGGGTALVLGGGGITGIAWEIGVLAGLRRGGVDLTGADLIVGTSAGSVVGATIASGVSLDTAIETQRTATGELPAVDVGLAVQAFMILGDRSLTPRRARAQVGALAVAAPVGDAEERVALFAALIPAPEWPKRHLIVTAVDATSGDVVAWDRDSGVPLARAVAASCAVPCVYPAVPVDGRHYIDGGVRSGTNADLATGATEVVVIAPMADASPLGAPAGELAALRERSKVVLVKPDEAAQLAIGPNVLDPARREAALESGIAQGESLAPEIASIMEKFG